jgi:translation initiation factor 4G
VTLESGEEKRAQQDIRSMILAECQHQFEVSKEQKAEEANGPAEEDSSLPQDQRRLAAARRAEANLKARRMALGNMQFVGFLYRDGMITEKVVHAAIQKLLADASPEELECACKLLATAGPSLEVRIPSSLIAA